MLSEQNPSVEILFPAAQSAKAKEEAFRGHMGKLRIEPGLCAAGLCFVQGSQEGEGRFLHCVMMNITRRKSSGFGMPWAISNMAHLECSELLPAMLQPKII